MQQNTPVVQLFPPTADEPDAEAAGAPAEVSAAAETGTAAEDGKRQERERSTIEFPYNDLNDAVTVAETIYRNFSDRCTPDQLAPALGHEGVRSGTFRTKMSAARLFGFVESGGGFVSLTSLGQQVVDPQRARHARVRAFLNVPLYRRLFDMFKGRVLPPEPGLEQAMVSLGVASKQRDKARQTFQRSADQAGLFYQGRNRLVLPPGYVDAADGPTPGDRPAANRGTAPVTDPAFVARQGRSDETGGDGGPGDPSGRGGAAHILIEGLFEALPVAGNEFGEQDRQAWITLAQSIFNVVYRKPSEA